MCKEWKCNSITFMEKRMTLEEPQQDKALNSENSPTRLLYIDCNVNKQRTHPLTYFGG